MCLFLGIHDDISILWRRKLHIADMHVLNILNIYLFSVIQFCVSLIPAICGGSGTCMIICYNLFTMSVSVYVDETCGGGT